MIPGNCLKPQTPYNPKSPQAPNPKYEATDPEDLWRIHHNDRADLHAKAVFLHLPEVISCAHNLMLTHIKLQTQRKLSAALYLRSVFDQLPWISNCLQVQDGGFTLSPSRTPPQSIAGPNPKHKPYQPLNPELSKH